MQGRKFSRTKEINGSRNSINLLATSFLTMLTLSGEPGAARRAHFSTGRSNGHAKAADPVGSAAVISTV